MPKEDDEASLVKQAERDVANLWDTTLNALVMLIHFAHLTLLQRALEIFPCKVGTSERISPATARVWPQFLSLLFLFATHVHVGSALFIC